MDTDNVQVEKEEQSCKPVENESDGLETACYRKCRGPFCLTPTDNHFQHEIPLDFAPFLAALTNYPASTYDRIESLLKLDHSIARVTHLITNKHISCVNLCLFYLKRIQTTNDYHKVILELNPNLVIDAEELDRQLNDKTVQHRLLVGCVVAVKGNISVRGLYNDAGSFVLHEKKMENDAPIVRKLREQGKHLFTSEKNIDLVLRLPDTWSNESVRMGICSDGECAIGILSCGWSMSSSWWYARRC